jgi:hypothetical protein
MPPILLRAARRVTRVVWGLALAAAPGLCAAQSQSAGDASLRIEYQSIHTGVFHDAGMLDATYSRTDSHIALISGDYALSDRWVFFAALPYVQKRFVAVPGAPGPDNGDPHNPNDAFWIDFVPPDKRFIDDGDYHGGFQNLSFGVSYTALDGPLRVAPYIGYGFPTNNYPIYAKAAIGRNLWSIPVGVDLMYVPYFSDWFFRGNLAYVFSEEPLDVNVDYWLGYLEGGYWFTPGFSVNAFLSLKYLRDGLLLPWSFTDDPTYANYPDDFDTIYWWQHDRLLRHRFLNFGIGFDYFVNDKYQLSGSYFTGIWSEQTDEVDYAFTLALTRYFGGD